ncbi:putative elongator complex protein 1 isoform X1 [Dreissena polymorpha]|nr:putative elongator complex protein 1 isoform X1 [Dreissena polymorpha]XP_052279527.1 putative elongator complex protein 1 isoform X1 [Dreissena polymorpha]
MRNLHLVSSLHQRLEDCVGAEHLAVNFDDGTVYCATERAVTAFQPATGEVVCSLDLSSVEDQREDARILGIHHLAEDQSLCIAITLGDILLWNLHSLQVECVGSVESGLTAMGWSPASEIICVTTGADTCILMTREFDPITELSLQPNTSGEAEFVQVGWGKKETQFHGSVGKQAAQVQPTEVKPVQDWDDRRPRISWRADGLFFAVSSIHRLTGARQVCVWTREGVHHSTSENVDGIEQALAWRPNGSLIATSQRKPNKHDIAFFEKNGLRHGEFTLPFSVNQVKVCEVSWNSNSSILAVWCEDLDSKHNTYIQLWTTGNYHWYLKQSLHFVGGEDRVGAVMWDVEQEYRLHIVMRSGAYHRYTWAWDTDTSTGRMSEDQAIVAVIDGASVLMTPTRHMVVPPPMSAYQLKLPKAVNHVVFAPPPRSNDVAVVMVDHSVAIYSFEGKPAGDGVQIEAAGGKGFQNCCQFPTLRGIVSITNLPDEHAYPLSLSHFKWVADDVIIFCAVVMETRPHSRLYRAKILPDTICVESSCRVESEVFGIAVDPETMCVAVQLEDGALLKYSVDDNLLLPWETANGQEVSFPVPCTQMAVCSIGNEMAVLGLTQRYRFYVNNVEVASNCTSMAVHDEFLLLTTLQHTVRCISRHTRVNALPSLSDGKAHPFDESIRRVERGSQIVVAVGEDTKLVLQMPRGNLETVHPRALVLTAVRKHLDKLQFNEAFMVMRKHRINMNLLYDHNPAAFISNVAMFVTQVAVVTHINLFLTDLLEEDVTVTMYTAAYERNKSLSAGSLQATPSSLCKVNTICDAVRKALIGIDENKYLLSILTTYVRKSKPELEQALQLVKKLRACTNELPHISAEEALRYLLFLVDVNELYDIALGTYDFDLVLMVAEKSQKDPKEYIPFLNELRRLESSYRMYTIDKHLKRYEKALSHIVKCGDERFAECMLLINQHHLHVPALQLYPPHSQQYKNIAIGYADVLSGKRRHDEAAIFYVKGEIWDMALTSFLACHQWQQVFCMTARLGYTQDREAAVARKLAEELKGRNRHSEAAVVLEQYAGDLEEAIVTLIQGTQWDEASRLMHKHKRTDFVETDFKPRLLESVDALLGNLESMKETFLKHNARLGVVRQEKERARLTFIESGGGGGVQEGDLFSDTSSATGESILSSAPSMSSSVYSKMSGRSVRNRRKAEHKKWRLKEGSEFEDCALIASLAKIVKYVDGLRDEVRSLVRTLVMFHYDSKGAELQRQYDTFLTLIDSYLGEIWLEEDQEADVKPVLGPTTTANSIALSLQQGHGQQSESEEGTEKTDPIIKFAPVLQKDKKWKLYALET